MSAAICGKMPTRMSLRSSGAALADAYINTAVILEVLALLAELEG
jgi:hypothetical protein